MGSTRKFPVLTDKAIAKAKPAPPKYSGHAYFLRDGLLRGLGVRVTVGGIKSFIYESSLGGRSRRWTLGPYPDLSLSAAREKARQWRLIVREGLDPTLERRRRRLVPTFGALCDRWVHEYARPEKRSAREDERRIAGVLKPWRNRQVSEITREDVLALQSRIRREHGPVESNRVLALVRAIFNKARDEWEVIETTPVERLRLYEEHGRERVLATDEIKRLIPAILAEQEPWRQVFLLYLFTGQRRREILSAVWTDIDFTAGSWTFPGYRRKNKCPHALPLTPLVRALLEEIPIVAGSPHVFPSPASKSGHLEEIKRPWRRVLERAGLRDLRPHDLRHAQATLQAQLGTSAPLISRILGHSSSASSARYINLRDTDPVRAPLERAERHLIEASPELGRAFDVTPAKKGKP